MNTYDFDDFIQSEDFFYDPNTGQIYRQASIDQAPKAPCTKNRAQGIARQLLWPDTGQAVFSTDQEVYRDPNMNFEPFPGQVNLKGVCYRYSDRMYGDRFEAAWQTAKQEFPVYSAEFFERYLQIALSEPKIKLVQIIVGRNSASWTSYRIFGYVIED